MQRRETPQSVKHENYANMHREIVLELGEIKGQLQGINQRLDKVNGRVAACETDVQGIKLSIAKFTGYIVAMSTVMAITWNILYAWARTKLGF